MIINNAIIFTDLDGTLLDHYTYSSEAALPTIVKLKAMNIPIVPTTSKTFAEVKQIVKSLDLGGPIIIENGAAIYLPLALAPSFNLDNLDDNAGYKKISFTEDHSHWMALLKEMESEFSEFYTSFTELGIEGIVAATGLSPEEAKLAANREHGEPVVWHGSDQQKQSFKDALIKLGASPIEGGRFIHICGNCSKGIALEWLAAQYEQHIYDAKPTTIALGDGNNDIAMLEVADIAVRVRSPSHAPPVLERRHNIITTQQFGPEGWANAISHIFSLK